ncbi:hypothetical protein VTK56DRAFT_892 [Thermocarpiscus australiensis]
MSSPTTTTPPPSIRLTQATALFLSSLASGVSLSLSALVVPRLLESPTPLMLHQWARTFAAGRATMPPAALATAAAYAWLAVKATTTTPGVVVGGGGGSRAGCYYAAAAALSVGVVPYTWAFMMRTNRRLLGMRDRVVVAGALEAESEEVGAEEEKGAKYLVDWWGMLNLGRAVMLMGASALGFAATF